MQENALFKIKIRYTSLNGFSWISDLHLRDFWYETSRCEVFNMFCKNKLIAKSWIPLENTGVSGRKSLELLPGRPQQAEHFRPWKIEIPGLPVPSLGTPGGIWCLSTRHVNAHVFLECFNLGSFCAAIQIISNHQDINIRIVSLFKPCITSTNFKTIGQWSHVFINQRRDQYLVEVEAKGVEQKHTHNFCPVGAKSTCPQARANTKYLDVTTCWCRVSSQTEIVTVQHTSQKWSISSQCNVLVNESHSPSPLNGIVE